MEYKIRIGERSVDVSRTELDTEQRMQFSIDGQNFDLKVLYSQSGSYGVEIDGQMVHLFTARCPEGIWVWHNGRARLVCDETREHRQTAQETPQSCAMVTPMTPGVVVKLMVKKGQKVKKGQALIVISAMKMESTLVAGYNGTVTAIHTEVGAQVMPGDILIEIQPNHEEVSNE